MKDEKLKDKFTADEKEKVQKLVDETSKWLEEHHEAEAEEYSHKQKELEEVFNPIMMRVYQQTGGAPPGAEFPGGAGFPGGAPTGGASNVDEVDWATKLDQIFYTNLI